MKKLGLFILIVIIFANGCCRIPYEVKKSEELQQIEALRIKVYLEEVKKNPSILIDPKYKDLNKDILEASKALMQSTEAQSNWLGHTPEFEKGGEGK
jgi:hypothetical protein